MPVDPIDLPTGALRRRLVTVPVLYAAWVVCLALLPVLAVLALVVDGCRRARGVPTIRLVGFAAVYLSYEAAGVLAAAWLWITRPVRPATWAARNRRLQHWWTNGLVRAAGPVLGLRIQLEIEAQGAGGDSGAFSHRPVIVLSRHVSILDSLLPAYVLGVGQGRHLRYVLTKGLRLDPCLDIVGHRLPNHFVDRGASDTTADLAALGRLGRDLGPEGAVVVFPEGGLFTPERRDRALARLEAGGSPRVEVAAGLRRLLPPRPAGTLALLAAAPDADVVVFAHDGFEPLGSLKRLWRVLPMTEPVRLRLVYHPRAGVPDDDAARIIWLDEQWASMDRWLVGAPARAGTGPSTAA